VGQFDSLSSSRPSTSDIPQRWSVTSAAIAERYAQGLVNPAEVVVHEVHRNGGGVVLDLLQETVSQPSKPAHAHAHLPALQRNDVEIRSGSGFPILRTHRVPRHTAGVYL
jgi:hypothetical protein